MEVKDLATKKAVDNLTTQVKELATKKAVDDLTTQVKELATKKAVDDLATQVKELATKKAVDDLNTQVKDLTMQLKDLATKASVTGLSTQLATIAAQLDRMAYNDRIRSVNTARINRGGIPMLPLRDVDGHLVEIRWRRDIQDGTPQKISTWAARFGLDPVAAGNECDVEYRAMHPFQRATVQRQLISSYIGAQ